MNIAETVMEIEGLVGEELSEGKRQELGNLLDCFGRRYPKAVLEYHGNDRRRFEALADACGEALAMVTPGIGRPNPETDEVVGGRPEKIGMGPCSADDLLEEVRGTLKMRAAERDLAAERSMKRAVKAFNALTGLWLTEVQGWCFMLVLKQARAFRGEFVTDDYIDMIGYAALEAEAALKERGAGE